MFDAEKLATLSDGELKALDGNVKRLGDSGTIQQKAEAERLTPLIAQEKAARKAAKPPPATPKPRAKKAKAKAED